MRHKKESVLNYSDNDNANCEVRRPVHNRHQRFLPTCPRKTAGLTSCFSPGTCWLGNTLRGVRSTVIAWSVRRRSEAGETIKGRAHTSWSLLLGAAG